MFEIPVRQATLGAIEKFEEDAKQNESVVDGPISDEILVAGGKSKLDKERGPY
jgi:hypothetical protein